MKIKDVLEVLRQAKTDLANKKSLRRSADAEAIRANARADQALEAEVASQARYDSAREAVEKAFPKGFRL